jgi:hypothetical protein
MDAFSIAKAGATPSIAIPPMVDVLRCPDTERSKIHGQLDMRSTGGAAAVVK